MTLNVIDGNRCGNGTKLTKNQINACLRYTPEVWHPYCRLWTPAPRPKGVRQDTMRECFRNAFGLAESNPELTYVEGVADMMFHAWCVDSAGNVVDPTWRFGRDYFPNTPFFGVPLRMEWLWRVRQCTGEHCYTLSFGNDLEVLHWTDGIESAVRAIGD